MKKKGNIICKCLCKLNINHYYNDKYLKATFVDEDDKYLYYDFYNECIYCGKKYYVSSVPILKR